MRMWLLPFVLQALLPGQVDGIAAIVNGEVISIGEVQRAAHLLSDPELERPTAGCGGLGATAIARRQDAPAAPAGSPPALDAALGCLIDGALVFREVRRFPQLDVTWQVVQTAYEGLIDLFPSPEGFRAALAEHGLTPDGLRRDLRRQLLVASYVDTRFRATVDVSEQEARAYFENELLPDMTARGIEPPPFQEVADAFVVPILREREVNRRVESWIQDLRARAQIDIRFPEPSPR